MLGLERTTEKRSLGLVSTDYSPCTKNICHGKQSYVKMLFLRFQNWSKIIYSVIFTKNIYWNKATEKFGSSIHFQIQLLSKSLFSVEIWSQRRCQFSDLVTPIGFPFLISTHLTICKYWYTVFCYDFCLISVDAGKNILKKAASKV